MTIIKVSINNLSANRRVAIYIAIKSIKGSEKIHNKND